MCPREIWARRRRKIGSMHVLTGYETRTKEHVFISTSLSDLRLERGGRTDGLTTGRQSTQPTEADGGRSSTPNTLEAGVVLPSPLHHSLFSPHSFLFPLQSDLSYIVAAGTDINQSTTLDFCDCLLPAFLHTRHSPPASPAPSTAQRRLNEQAGLARSHVLERQEAQDQR